MKIIKRLRTPHPDESRGPARWSCHRLYKCATRNWIPAFAGMVMMTGCATIEGRHETATDIARAAAMTGRVIPAGLFNLTAFERVTRPQAPVDLYIEGDGRAWLSAHTKSMNPTPLDPTALHLAAKDKAENVIYMARPCQYTGWNGGGACPDAYWSQGRTAVEVIQAYNQALDNIKIVYAVNGFNLIGYSGGAGVAALLAAERGDILSLRTVAGNTDYTAFTSLHRISPMSASLNPADVAPKLAKIPQLHFIGGEDKVIPPAIFASWQRASGESPCVQSVTVSGVTHEKGWTEKWPELLNAPLSCVP